VDERPYEVTVEEMYGPSELSKDEMDALLDRSLSPRGPDMLFDLAGALGLSAHSRVLDVGCRDGRHMVELVRRFGWRTFGVEPVRANLDRRKMVIGGEPAETVGRLHFAQGRIERLPFPDGSFNLVWARDMLIHVPDLAGALAECRRVLSPDGRLVVYAMFATPWLEPGEAARLWPPLAALPASADPAHFERCVAAAGLAIERQDEIRSEWREFAEESGTRTTSTQLLRAARLLRDRDRLVSELGRASYEVELANCLWGVYQMIGKLSGRVYVLSAAGR